MHNFHVLQYYMHQLITSFSGQLIKPNDTKTAYDQLLQQLNMESKLNLARSS